ncbi:MAG: type II toxin-antitoxin system HicA family toxin [Magnetococcales bacterium]|nr:type II toxin-antitoxin system HicA family toxin [Magnetococcales bacterium]MBF0151867.1 type II toxin-antitoxin system HicA family toxin [Magnetococcales bacterium]MBF0629553.1 type II toxin-antitoxin system HicA family toxin [Magnetococcales bacterium]
MEGNRKKRVSWGRFYPAREIIDALKAAGWVLSDVSGSHYQFVHPGRPGKVTVPHPRKIIPMGTIKSIERQSGLKIR